MSADNVEWLNREITFRESVSKSTGSVDTDMLRVFRAEIVRLRGEVDEIVALREIARLIGTIFFAGDFKAETANERALEALLIANGYRYRSWDEVHTATITTIAPAEAKGVTSVFRICVAYEAGYGKGLQRSTAGNPYVAGPEHEAWGHGYAEGLDKFGGTPGTPRPTGVEDIAAEEVYIRDGAGSYVLCDLQETTFDDLPLYCARAREITPQPAGGEAVAIPTMPIPRTRDEAIALAREVLRQLGIIDLLLDEAIARCEAHTTPPAARVQGEGAAERLYLAHIQAHPRAGRVPPWRELAEWERAPWIKAAHPSACELGAVREALEKVAKWELPRTGKFWPSGTECSYEGEYGSQGVRQYFQQLARAALQHRGDSRGGEGWS